MRVSRVSCVLILASSVIGVTCLMGCCQGTQPTDTDHGIRIRLTASKTDYAVDEEVAFTIELTNLTQSSISLPRLDPWSCYVFDDLGGASAEERWESETHVHVEPWPKNAVPKQGRIPVLPPRDVIPSGKSLSRSFNLADTEEGAILPPGKYKIWVDYYASTEDMALQVVSNAVKIRVLEKMADDDPEE